MVQAPRDDRGQPDRERRQDQHSAADGPRRRRSPGRVLELQGLQGGDGKGRQERPRHRR